MPKKLMSDLEYLKSVHYMKIAGDRRNTRYLILCSKCGIVGVFGIPSRNEIDEIYKACKEESQLHTQMYG